MTQKIERVDSIPLIISKLKQMGVDKNIDKYYVPHTNWSGISYGQLALLYITYVLYMTTHQLSSMELWVEQHQNVLELTTGWKISPKDATDDRLGRLLEVLGMVINRIVEFQIYSGGYIISAYSLPTEMGRYDTTSFNVYHRKGNPDNGLLEFGYSKNYRPDLLQFKQGLGTLDPAGVPLFSDTIPGNRADDRCYTPAWEQMAKTIGHTDFLFIADCKAASLETRTAIDKGKGLYLFPLPMTGDTPKILKDLVMNPPAEPQKIILEPRVNDKEDKPREIGVGFEVKKQTQVEMSDGEVYELNERWIVSKSNAHAERQIKGVQDRLDNACEKLKSLKPKKGETEEELLARGNRILKNHGVSDLITVKVNVLMTEKKQYEGKGRPGPNTPFQIVTVCSYSISYELNESAITNELMLAGWRIYVTNTDAERMTVNQSARYYRDEWLVERGFHRFKKGCLPALPLFVRIPERIRGLMMLLTIALQAVTLIEYVIRCELAQSQDEIAGLVPGNPKMKTKRPTTERILSQFNNINLLIKEDEKQCDGVIVEALNPLQLRILSLLKFKDGIYDLNFTIQKSKIGTKTVET